MWTTFAKKMTSNTLLQLLEQPELLPKYNYEELKTLVVQYPYCQNLRWLLWKRSQMDGRPDEERNRLILAAYSFNRSMLYHQHQETPVLIATGQRFMAQGEAIVLPSFGGQQQAAQGLKSTALPMRNLTMLSEILEKEPESAPEPLSFLKQQAPQIPTKFVTLPLAQEADDLEFDHLGAALDSLLNDNKEEILEHIDDDATFEAHVLDPSTKSESAEIALEEKIIDVEPAILQPEEGLMQPEIVFLQPVPVVILENENVTEYQPIQPNFEVEHAGIAPLPVLEPATESDWVDVFSVSGDAKDVKLEVVDKYTDQSTLTPLETKGNALSFRDWLMQFGSASEFFGNEDAPSEAIELKSTVRDQLDLESLFNSDNQPKRAVTKDKVNEPKTHDTKPVSDVPAEAASQITDLSETDQIPIYDEDEEDDILAEIKGPAEGYDEVAGRAKQSVKPNLGFVTETLAKIMEDQEHWERAIEMYRYLYLQKPEKSAIFAAKIEELEQKMKG
jgi:hypothetical protein